MTSQRPFSIQDVAEKAEVSTATVSRVLNRPELVSPATADRVHKAIKALGYKPNRFAQGLMTRRSKVLGIALPDIHGEFYSELLRGADAEAKQLGYHLLVSSEVHAVNGDAGRGSLAFGLIDGLALMISEPNESLWTEAQQFNTPIVVLDADLRDRGVDSVIVDNEAGTREATHHLLASLRPNMLYFVGGGKDNFDTRQRAKAFVQTLKEAEWAARPDQTAFGEYSLDWGYRWAKEAAAKGLLKGAGVLAGNDEIAYGVLEGARDAGLRVPEDTKIVGFDDTRLARLIRPRLSTVRVPLADIGAAAIRVLVRRVNDPDAEPAVVRVPTTLVVRDSSTAAA